MAEEAAAQEAAPSKTRTPIMKSNVVRILIYVAVVVMVAAIAFMVAYLTMQAIESDDPKTGPVIQKEGSRDLKPPPAIEPLGVFTTILIDQNERSYNMRVKIDIGIEGDEDEVAEVKAELTARKIQIHDAIYEVLIGTDPRSFMGSAEARKQGLNQLRAVVTQAINANMKNKIDRVYLTEPVIQ